MIIKGSYICIENEENEGLREFCERVHEHLQKTKTSNAVCVYKNAEFVVHDTFPVDVIYHNLLFKVWEDEPDNEN